MGVQRGNELCMEGFVEKFVGKMFVRVDFRRVGYFGMLRESVVLRVFFFLMDES